MAESLDVVQDHQVQHEAAGQRVDRTLPRAVPNDHPALRGPVREFGHQPRLADAARANHHAAMAALQRGGVHLLVEPGQFEITSDARAGHQRQLARHLRRHVTGRGQ